MTATERAVIISGIGRSEAGRRLGRSGLDLTLEASYQAIADAGLNTSDIDGLASYPGHGGPAGGAAVSQVHDALRLELSWHSGFGEGPGQITAILHACLAVAVGFARHVLVYRTVVESSAHVGGVDPLALADAVPGSDWMRPWMTPYSAASVPAWIALLAQRHMHDYGTTKDQLGAVAITQRRHAARNPRAVYRDPLSLDEYRNARLIAPPFGLYDCDVPVDGATAFVVSTADYAPDAPQRAIQFDALGMACATRRQWGEPADVHGALRDAAKQMWSRTSLQATDVNAAFLYDGFSAIPLFWLEALGFCAVGDGGPLAASGAIDLDGALPMNTDGGQLSAGRLHGYGHLFEACLQLREQAHGRQVLDADIVVVANGVGPTAGCLLLTR